MGLFVRKVKTASGATAAQIAHTKRGVQKIVEHIGSAHTEAETAALVQVAKDKIAGDQLELELQLPVPSSRQPAAAVASAGPVVTGTSSQLLWDTLNDAYDRIGFAGIGNDTFKRLVLARLVEPTSKTRSVVALKFKPRAPLGSVVMPDASTVDCYKMALFGAATARPRESSNTNAPTSNWSARMYMVATGCQRRAVPTASAYESCLSALRTACIHSWTRSATSADISYLRIARKALSQS